MRTAVVEGDVGEVQDGAVRRDRGPQIGSSLADAVAVREDGVDAQVRRVLDERSEVVEIGRASCRERV